jgi:hypothetical protein
LAQQRAQLLVVAFAVGLDVCSEAIHSVLLSFLVVGRAWQRRPLTPALVGVAKEEVCPSCWLCSDQQWVGT